MIPICSKDSKLIRVFKRSKKTYYVNSNFKYPFSDVYTIFFMLLIISNISLSSLIEF